MEFVWDRASFYVRTSRTYLKDTSLDTLKLWSFIILGSFGFGFLECAMDNMRCIKYAILCKYSKSWTDFMYI